MIIAHDLSTVGILLHTGRGPRWLQALAERMERSLERPVVLRTLTEAATVFHSSEWTAPSTAFRSPTIPAGARPTDLAGHRLAEHGRAILTLYHQFMQERRASIGCASGKPSHEFAECHFSQRTAL